LREALQWNALDSRYRLEANLDMLSAASRASLIRKDDAILSTCSYLWKMPLYIIGMTHTESVLSDALSRISFKLLIHIAMAARVRVWPAPPSPMFPAADGSASSRWINCRSPKPCPPLLEGWAHTHPRPHHRKPAWDPLRPRLSSTRAGGMWVTRRQRHAGSDTRPTMGILRAHAWVSPRKKEEDGKKEKWKKISCT
jgi:hypothetical protein